MKPYRPLQEKLACYALRELDFKDLPIQISLDGANAGLLRSEGRYAAAVNGILKLVQQKILKPVFCVFMALC